MVVVISTKIVVFFNIGSVMYRNCCFTVAPSGARRFVQIKRVDLQSGEKYQHLETYALPDRQQHDSRHDQSWFCNQSCGPTIPK